MANTRSKSRRSQTNFPYLPLELWFEVLIRLPAKTLLKFRCVCKDWKSTIENPKFVSSHLNSFKNNHELAQLLVIETIPYESSKVSASIRSATTFRRSRKIKYFKNLPRNFRVEGYAAGLLLWKRYDLSNQRVSGFVVSNPSILKTRRIPIPPSPFTRRSWVGLGYDSDNDDCKVVFFSVESNDSRSSVMNDPSQSHHNQVLVSVHIYSINNQTWKTTSLEIRFLRCRGYYNTSIFLNGTINWIGYDVGLVPYPSGGSHIVAFDLHNEVFGAFGLPHDRGMDASSSLSVLGDSLALIDYDHRTGHFTVHVMEQYGVAESWVKRFTFDLVCDNFLYLKRDGELFVTLEEHVKSCQIESGKIKDLTRTHWDPVIFMGAFVESLVLLT